MFDNDNMGHFLTNRFGDTYLYDVNGSAFDKIGSEAVYKKHFAKGIFQKDKFNVILGTDSGLLPKYLEKSGLPEGSRFLFVELPDVLEKIKDVSPAEGFDGKITITTFDQWLEKAKDFEYQNFFYLNNARFVSSVGAEDMHREEYQELARFIQEEFEQVRWALNAQIGNEAFCLRQLENLPEERVSASCLKESFSGKTAVILGGGPSLDEALPWLLENRDNLVVFAVSRIARRLLQVGFSPDVIASIDPHPVSFDVSKEMLRLWDKTLFAHMNHVSSRLLGQWRGRNVFMGPRFPWKSTFNEEGILTQGPTVTNCAIDLAIEMGFSKILLAGVDLCFSQQGFTHAKGSNEFQVGPQLGFGQFWVETNGGWTAETTADFHFAIGQIARQAEKAAQRGSQIFNLGLGAAQIAGVQFLAFEDVEVAPLPQPAWELLASLLPPDTAEARNAYYNEILAELDRAVASFNEIKELSVDALDANEKFFGRRGKGKGSSKYRVRMDKIEKKLKNRFPDFSMLVKKFGIRDFLKLTQGDQNKEWSEEEVDQLGQIYYEAYRDSAGRLLDMVEEARERLLNRIEEENDMPNFEALFRQWEKDEQPGRALVWQTRHPEKALPPPVIQKLETLAAEFNKVLENEETRHLERTRSLSDLGPVRGKLCLMFKRNQKEHLRKMTDSLSLLEEEEAKALYCLGRGFAAELDGDADAALQEYHQLIDEKVDEEPGPTLEEALRRILSISLEKTDSEHAVLAAECLSSISPVYLPYYADLIWLVGDKAAALDLYADYLEKVPGDTTVMLKLGRFYKELEVEQGARLMFNAVLEKDPLNQAAVTFLAELDARFGT